MQTFRKWKSPNALRSADRHADINPRSFLPSSALTDTCTHTRALPTSYDFTGRVYFRRSRLLAGQGKNAIVARHGRYKGQGSREQSEGGADTRQASPATRFCQFVYGSVQNLALAFGIGDWSGTHTECKSGIRPTILNFPPGQAENDRATHCYDRCSAALARLLAWVGACTEAV
jgi:hypothetical protein